MTYKNLIYLLLLFPFLSNAQNNQLAVTFNPNLACNETNYTGIVPAFESSNGSWKASGNITPKQAYYIYNRKEIESLNTQEYDRMEINDEENTFIIQSERLAHYQDTNNILQPLLLCNHSNAQLLNSECTLSKKEAQNKIKDWLKSQMLKNSFRLQDDDQLVSKVSNVIQLSSNTFVVVATCPFDIYKIDHPTEDPIHQHEPLQSQLSKQHVLENSVFLFKNNKIKILGHEMEILAVGDFNNDKKNEIIFTQFEEVYNNLFLLQADGKLITRALWGN